MSEQTKIHESETNEPKTTLPLSYVMWLTIRSRFIDELAKTQPDILDKWKAYETVQIDILETAFNNTENE